MKRLGERIKRKREDLHLRLNELAQKVGISPGALSQIEKAKAFPSITTLKSIADNLYTTVGELIGENEILTNNPLVKFSEKSFIVKNTLKRFYIALKMLSRPITPGHTCSAVTLEPCQLPMICHPIKKGLSGVLLNQGEKEDWVTARFSQTGRIRSRNNFGRAGA